MPEPARSGDPLAELRERLEATREEAARLAGDAAAAAGAEERGEEPPRGWRTAEERQALRDDLQALLATVGQIADLIPADVREHLVEVLRQILLLLRAVIDWLVERLAPAPGAGPLVRDIPVA